MGVRDGIPRHLCPQENRKGRKCLDSIAIFDSDHNVCSQAIVEPNVNSISVMVSGARRMPQPGLRSCFPCLWVMSFYAIDTYIRPVTSHAFVLCGKGQVVAVSTLEPPSRPSPLPMEKPKRSPSLWLTNSSATNLRSLVCQTRFRPWHMLVLTRIRVSALASLVSFIAEIQWKIAVAAPFVALSLGCNYIE